MTHISSGGKYRSNMLRWWLTILDGGGGDDDDDDDDNDVVVGEVVVSIRLSGDNCLIETVERTDDNCI